MAIDVQDGGIDLGPENRRSSRVSEIVKIVGSTGAANDTDTYRLKHGHKDPIILGGAFAISATSVDAAGVTITVKALVAIGNDTVYAEVMSNI